MANPLQAQFWEEERVRLWAEFNGLVMDTMLAGASNAIPLLPAAVQPLLSWEVFNQAAIEWMRSYRSDILEQIDIVTEKRVRTLISDWVQAGDSLRVLETQLAPIFGETRATAIAATEVTRIFAEGNMMAWRATGLVGGKVWQTARDELVCPICGPLHNQQVEIDSNFQLSADTIAQSPAMRKLLGSRYNPEAALRRALQQTRNIGSAWMSPPAHPRCRCWLKPVVDVVQVEEQIGGLLAQQLFTAIRGSQLVVVDG